MLRRNVQRKLGTAGRLPRRALSPYSEAGHITRSAGKLRRVGQRGMFVRLLPLRNEGANFRICGQVQFTRVLSQHPCKLDDDFFGGMAFRRFEVTDVRDRRTDSASNFFLRQVELASAVADYRSEARAANHCYP